MPNVFLTPDIIAKEALMVLENNLVMAGLVHRDYSQEFVKVGDTITVRKPAKFVANNFVSKIERQDAIEGSIPVKMDRFRDVSVPVTSRQLTLDINNFSQQVVTPAMQAIAQAVDSDILALGVQQAGSTVDSKDSDDNLKPLGNIGKKFDLKAVPMQNRRLVMHPTHKYRYVTVDNLSKVSYAGTSQSLRDAEIGKIYTMDTFMSQNAPDISAETTGTAKTYKVTAAEGDNVKTVDLSAVSPATGTIKAGDAFIIDGYLYRFMEDKTAESGVITGIKIDQPVHRRISLEDAYAVKSTHSLAFHRNGIALVTRQLELPMGAAKAAIASANGLAVRVVFGYDQDTKVDTISFDTIYGIKELNKDMIVKLVG